MPAVRTVLPSPSAGNLELVIAASPDASPGVRLSNGYFYGSSLKHRDRRHRRALPSCIPPPAWRPGPAGRAQRQQKPTRAPCCSVLRATSP